MVEREWLWLALALSDDVQSFPGSRPAAALKPHATFGHFLDVVTGLELSPRHRHIVTSLYTYTK